MVAVGCVLLVCLHVGLRLGRFVLSFGCGLHVCGFVLVVRRSRLVLCLLSLRSASVVINWLC